MQVCGFHVLRINLTQPLSGFIHIILNMLAQYTLSAQVHPLISLGLLLLTDCSQIEREMGSGGFIITYFVAGIFGFVCATVHMQPH